jgi:hypothetical protein
MPSCRNCGTNVGSSDNFCPNCATPQNDEASRRLNEYIDRRAQQLAGSGGRGGSSSDGSDLQGRVQYAIGYLAIVVGVATLIDGPGLFFLAAGLFVLPPVQRLIETRLGRPLGTRPTAAAVTALSVLGAAAFVVV